MPPYRPQKQCCESRRRLSQSPATERLPVTNQRRSIGQCAACRHQHSVCYARRTTGDSPQTDSRENIHVITLRNRNGAPIKFNCITGAAGRDDGLSPGPANNIFWPRFHSRGGIRQRHNNRVIAVLIHRANHLLREQSGPPDTPSITVGLTV